MSKIDVRLLGMINELQNTGVDTTARAAIAEHATQLAEIGTCPATNIALNSNFDNGDNWYYVNASGSVAGNGLLFTATAQNGYVGQNVQWVQGHKYYVGAWIDSDDAGTALLIGDNVNFNTIVATHTGSGGYVFLHGVVDVTTAVSAANAHLSVRDTRASGFTPIGVFRPMCLDLTAIFGAGREPTLAQMEAYLAVYWPNGWFDGTANLARADKLVPFLFGEIRSLRAAVVALGGTL